MAASSLVKSRPAVVALGLLASVALSGCGYTLEQTSRIEAREQALVTAERRIGELEGALRAERQTAREAREVERTATDELATLRRRLRTARVQVAALERSRVATDAPTPVLGDGIESVEQRLAELERRATDEEARRQALQDEAEWTQRTLTERQQTIASLESRLQALQAEVAAAEADLADRRREVTGLREQIARERGTAAPPAQGGAQPQGGGSPR